VSASVSLAPAPAAADPPGDWAGTGDHSGTGAGAGAVEADAAAISAARASSRRSESRACAAAGVRLWGLETTAVIAAAVDDDTGTGAGTVAGATCARAGPLYRQMKTWLSVNGGGKGREKEPT
jgi:hypothetical protein